MVDLLVRILALFLLGVLPAHLLLRAVLPAYRRRCRDRRERSARRAHCAAIVRDYERLQDLEN